MVRIAAAGLGRGRSVRRESAFSHLQKPIPFCIVTPGAFSSPSAFLTVSSTAATVTRSSSSPACTPSETLGVGNVFLVSDWWTRSVCSKRTMSGTRAYWFVEHP